MNRWTRAMSSLIGLFAPEKAIKYAAGRQRLARYTGYGGASPDGPNKGWRPVNRSEDALLAKDREALMARARDLERNSGHISGAISKIVNNVVYTGMYPHAKLATSDGKKKDQENKRINKAWKKWAESRDVQFYEIQDLVLRHLWIDGEVLVHKYFDRDLYNKGLCPLALEVLEADFLDSTLTTENSENGNRIKQGIEYSKKGRPVAYHIFKEHPGETGPFARMAWGAERRRVPVENMRHIFFRKRASQSRGVSWMSSIIMEMRDFSEYQNSERIAARLASAFGAFVESVYPEHQYQHPLFGDNEAPSVNDIPSYLEPGRIDVLPPGMKINVAQYNRPGDSYEPFTKTSLKGASAGTGMSYENFSNDYEGSTYSSARQAILEERRGYRKMQWFLVRNFLNWVWQSWITDAHVSRIVGTIPEEVPVSWRLPGWDWIDPQKDARGAQLELEMHITNRRRLSAQRGFDWDEDIEDLQEEEEILREKEIKEAEQDARYSNHS